MIEIKSIASSSKGNCYYISNGNTSLLIECGIKIKEIKESLNFNLSKIDGCIISHLHADHSKSINNIIRCGIDCYATKETIKAAKTKSNRANIIKELRPFNIGTFKIMAFESIHDCEGSVGFLISSGDEKLLFLTDSAYCKYTFKDLTYIMIECNYCEDILKENIDNGSIPIALKNRLLFSHMSLETLIKFFKANDLSKVKEIHLMHLSLGNSDKRIVKESVQKATGKPIYICEE